MSSLTGKGLQCHIHSDQLFGEVLGAPEAIGAGYFRALRSQLSVVVVKPLLTQKIRFPDLGIVVSLVHPAFVRIANREPGGGPAGYEIQPQAFDKPAISICSMWYSSKNEGLSGYEFGRFAV